ncbi:MAG: coenzyme F420-0:L-glutamate ligase [Candidatus Nitrosocosmicus sp.]
MIIVSLPITIIPIKINKNIKANDDVSDLIIESANLNNVHIHNHDVIVIAQKIISKSENRVFYLADVIPSKKALDISSIHNKDPRLIELILRESIDIVKVSEKTLIVETKYGFICANAGIDQSNVSSNAEEVLLLPENPDGSAKRIRQSIYKKTGINVSIIISDTFGRPFRKGQTNVAIGIAGINPIKSYIGQKDSFDKILKVTEIAIVDELASSAELVMGKTLGIPIVLIKGYEYDQRSLIMDSSNCNDLSIKSIFRNKNQDLFRNL